jgi:hypothetical protein
MSEDKPKHLVYHCYGDCTHHWKGNLSLCMGVGNNWMGVCGAQLLGSLYLSMGEMSNWRVVCGHQGNGILLVGKRESKKIVMEMDAGAGGMGVGVLNKVTGQRNGH